MGSTITKITKHADLINEHIKNASNVYEGVKKSMQGTAVGGGGYSEPDYFGGGDDAAAGSPAKSLRQYRHSIAAAAKDRVIRGLATALKNAGIDVNPDADAETIVQELKAKLPNPRNHKTFKIDAGVHKKLCTSIATVLNEEFTPGAPKKDALIDTSLEPASVCRQVADLVHSMATGLHTEFVDVHADLTKTLRRMEVLREVIEKLSAKMLDQVKKAPDLGVGGEKVIGEYERVLARAQKFFQQQVEHLKQILSVKLAPAQKELEIAMRDESEDHDLIEGLKLVPGTREFSDALAAVVSGLGSIAAISARVDASLKEVGISLDEYAAASDIAGLQRELDAKLLDGKVDSKHAADFLRAVAVLKDNFERRRELVKTGGDEESRKTKVLDRRIKDAKSDREFIVKDFVDKVAKGYDRFLKAVQEAGPLLGRVIPLSDKLEQLRNAVARLGQGRVGAADLELSLMGLVATAAGREKKAAFVTDLRLVLRTLDELVAMSAYAGEHGARQFGEMRAAIDVILKTVDVFSDIIVKKYGGKGPALKGDDHKTSKKKTKKGGNGFLPVVAKTAYDITLSVNTFLYFFYVAKVRANLSQTHKELEVYGEKYTSILGDAVAARLKTLKAEKDAALAALTTAIPEPVLADVANDADALVVAKAVHKKKVAAATDAISGEYKCKNAFYLALQALDLYMKAFTEGIVAHPDDISEIKRILDGVQVIGRWFTEGTGDDLANAFENAPKAVADGVPAFSEIDTDETAGHYYLRVKAKAGEVGDPTLAIPLVEAVAEAKHAAKAQEFVDKTYDNFQALKNIVNAFARIGSKFGGKELHRQVFMSPTQMYKAFVDYLKRSALSYETVAAIPGRVGRLGVPAVPTVQFSSIAQSNFKTEDKYFSFCVKAMGAKVLTVLGVYDLFERPSPVYDLTPTRMIIGGGGEYDAPEVIPGAAELYFRLPRLAEFYKDLFDFKNTAGDTQISMLPEVEGVYSGLIRLIFMQADVGGVFSAGDYSDVEVQALVREINSIYGNFRGESGDVIGKALAGFVMEINRRYGIVKRDEWNKYEELLKQSRNLSANISGLSSMTNQTNYSILPGEEESQSRRSAPSDRFVGLGALGDLGKAGLPSGDFAIDSEGSWNQWDLLSEFRNKLDDYFNNVRPGDFTSFTYSTIIHQGELEITRASDNSKRLEVVTRLVQGSASLAGIDVSKAFLFHETVVVGLNTLSGLYTMMKNIADFVEKNNTVRIRAAIMNLTIGVNNLMDEAEVRTIAGALMMPDTARLPGIPARVANAPVLGPAQLISRFYAVADDNNKVLASIYGVNNSKAMVNILAVVASLTTNMQNLVQVRFPNTTTNQISLDFSKFVSVVTGLMGDVKYYLDLLRPYIAKDVIGKYEMKDNVGSVYWLEEKLIDEMIRGTVGGESPAMLNVLSRKINDIYVDLVGYKRYAFTAAGVLEDGGVDPVANAKYYLQYGNALSGAVFYDFNATNSGVESTFVPLAVDKSGINGLIVSDRLLGPLKSSVNTNLIGRQKLWMSDAKILNKNRSMLFGFNQLLAMYLSQFYDASTKRIYRNLIDGFANSNLNQSIMSSGFSIPDLSSSAANANQYVFGKLGDPRPSAVLLQSLGVIINRMITDINPTTQISDHLIGTLSDVPIYIRENYRAKLPIFVKLFTLIQKEGDLLKQVVSQTKISLGRELPSAAANIFRMGGFTQASTTANAYTDSIVPITDCPATPDAVKLSVLRLIDAISSACYSVANSASEVLREIADVNPLFLETQQSSIQEYKSRYGKLPLMPLSSVLTYFRDTGTAADEQRMMPVSAVGTEDFKLLYGTRKLFGQPSLKFSLDDAPGVKQVVENYNATAESGARVELAKYESFLANDVAALRFIVDLRFARAAIAPAVNNPFLAKLLAGAVAVRGENIAIINAPAVAPVTNTILAAYQVLASTPVMATLEITESTMQDQEAGKIGKVVGGTSAAVGVNRKRELIMNIIDMNIIPVNVHALMRSIPLAPLYNYAYTFDQMACMMYGESVSGLTANVIATGGNTKNTRQMFLKMLVNPFIATDTAVYGRNPSGVRGANGYVQRIFRGDDSLMMGRPKFISDQIYNKALFGSLTPSDPTKDETGPRGSARLEVGISSLRDTVRELPRDNTVLSVITYTTTVDEKLVVEDVKMNDGDADVNRERLNVLDAVGKKRFDTTLVRNLTFITNVQRLLRLKLDQEMTQYRNVLVSDHSIVNPGVTEYGFLPAQSGRRFVGPLETATDKQYDSDTRFER